MPHREQPPARRGRGARDDRDSGRGGARDRRQARDTGDDGQPSSPSSRSHGKMFEARAYTPRGRTVREGVPRPPRPVEEPRARRTGGSGSTPATARGDRPALRVLDGGRQGERRGTAAREPRRRGTAARERDRDAVPAPRRKAASPPGNRPAPVRKPRHPRRPPKLGDPGRRLRVASLLALVMLATVGVRLVVLQFGDTPEWAKQGLQDRLKVVTLPAARGAIYDVNGAVLAHSVEARYIAVDPEVVKDANRTASLLAPILGLSKSELLERMRKRTRPGGGPSNFEWLARAVSTSDAKKIEALELPEIVIGRDEKREWPGRDLAANLIGFTGAEMYGLEGIEARYDQLLRGVNGERRFEVGKYVDGTDLAKEIPGGYSQQTPAKDGSSLTLTIDRDMQYETQRIIGELMVEAGVSIGAAVVLDARTGEVRAQASFPTYDPVEFDRADPEDRQDVASAVVVDPGSVHKALIYGAALEEGVITPETVLEVGPSVRKGGVTFRDTHPFDEGTRITMAGAMAYSSNVAAIQVADQLGPEKVVEYQKRFGLGQSVNEGVDGEAAGRVLEVGEWSGSTYGSVPIGHSVDATLLQMAAAYGAIANDGVYVQPHLIKDTVAPDGTVTANTDVASHRVLSADTAGELRTLLESVMEVPDGSGRDARVNGYRVAGKTGTSSRLAEGSYLAGEVSSFIGMAPAENPRFVVAVFAHTPKSGGGPVAGPAFKEIMSFALRHYKVPPSTTEPPEFTVRP
ncbi:penicillin-binding transpeptidase domain-containing protein [Catenuloplanes atrovinosus]|uniref:Cell division protein FtsI (Penicillin-binding protein 3) n=1 Tax=Catenuloplanes atrovinosus TaxID=137266 RepID=A0AAE3YR98_9ACTN|nr:penicillin-binding transpeptidase domain-containing protein [Catenuloplanes atrovinosus]MDR7278165.1 cell division protein FtsI (penicillin-binding protein 3) [Catenuloplanes atrovinosus]